MFFVDHRRHFFRPFNSKYREQIIECLRAFYARLYSSMADHGRSYIREQVIDIFQEAITRAPVLEAEGEDEFSVPVRGEREQANWVLNLLLEHGWIERLVDEATLSSTYAFSRYGRLFTQPMVETATGRFRTRHRNTRNTRNALQSFLDAGEVYDLLDAFEYSERIISDFSDVIAELDERKRQLVQEVEAQQVVQRASDEFFDFMEKRFMPDLSIRLSADSVEKYRDEIQGLINKARRKQKDFKAQAERELRRSAPELITDPKQSLYLLILDGIESRMSSASEIMLPALRHALNSFTRRADIIIRQLSYSTGGHQSHLLEVCQGLQALSDEEREQRLAQAGASLASLQLALPDPDSLRLYAGRTRRVVNTAVEEHGEMEQEARKRLFIDQALELAFAVNNQELRNYISGALSKGHRIHSQHLPVQDAKQLLLNAHAIEIGAKGVESSEYYFHVEPSGQQVQTDYFAQTDEFIIELVERA
ncbi:MAG: Wadjet anti-phage system protein JetA family protein [Pseudomonadota bacterium]